MDEKLKETEEIRKDSEDTEVKEETAPEEKPEEASEEMAEEKAEEISPEDAAKKKKKRLIKAIVIPSSIVAFLAAAYLLIAFSNIPFIAYWRTIWIETAMTTGTKQWLATAFFPESVVNDVMKDFKTNTDVVGGGDALRPKDEDTTSQAEDTTSTPDEPDEPEAPADPLGQNTLNVGDKDYAGNTVLVNDKEEGLVISEIIGNGYRGQIMLIDDPARVFIGTTVRKGEEGMRILDMMEVYGAVAGTNASGFRDPGGEGMGGEVAGLTMSNGETWGKYNPNRSSMVITTDNKLVVGNVGGNWKDYNIRDGMQFYPVLIADGERQVQGSGGYGLQPRTAVGQREDGVMCFLIIDGRNPGWSIGCTVGDMADILESYGIINAACCDGGASSALAYGGEITTKNCSQNPTIGRLLPNAFMVRSKKEME